MANTLNPPRSLPVMLAMLVSMTPFALSTYLPAFVAISESFGTSITQVQFSLTLFLLGFAFGQLLGGPTSDALGRRPVALAGISTFIAASVLIAFSQTIEQLLVFRFIQALGGGFSIVTASAIVRDLYNKQDSARMLSAIGILVLMAPLAAPAAGSLLLNLFGWRSIFWLLVTYSSTLLVVLFFMLPETRTSPKERFNPPKVVRNYLQVLNHRRAMCFIFTQSFSSGMQFSFLTASAFIYMEYFGVSSELYPLLFAANILSMMVFNRLNYQLLNRWQPELILKTGITLQLAANSALLVFSLSNPQLTGFMLLVMLAIGTQSMIWPNASACTLSYFPRNSGSATALTGSLRFLMGASTGSLISLLHDGTLMTITIMMFCCSGCSMLAYRLAMAIPAPEMPREAKGL